MPFQKKHYYHPQMRGKYSIKIVLPLLAPDMAKAYEELSLVSNGDDAMNTFPKLKEWIKMRESNTKRHN